jgi:ParB family transcriptional regulator, chromosome partitioning protein
MTQPRLNIGRGRVRVVLMKDIAAGGMNPRTDVTGIAELAESIRQVGVLLPLLVKGEEPPYQLIAGKRRLRAARMAGLAEVPAICLDTDEATGSFIAIIENVQRQNLNPLEEAEAFEKLVKEFTQQEIATAIGKSQPYVANALRLLKLPPSVLARVAAGELSRGHAVAILKHSPDRREAVADRAVAESLTQREVEKLNRGGRHVAEDVRGTEMETDMREAARTILRGQRLVDQLLTAVMGDSWPESAKLYAEVMDTFDWARGQIDPRHSDAHQRRHSLRQKVTS